MYLKIWYLVKSCYVYLKWEEVPALDEFNKFLKKGIICNILKDRLKLSKTKINTLKFN